GTTLSGNVILGGHAGEQADSVHGDGATVTHIQGDAEGKPVPADTSADTVVAGKYGDLTIHADGSYTYTLVTEDTDPERYADLQALSARQTGNQAAQDVFIYTLTDRDGDTNTSTLTIRIDGTNDAPTITFGQDGADANTVVSEEGLGLNLNPFRPPLHGSGLED